MRVWDLTSAAARLEAALRALHVASAEALAGWDDRVARGVHEQYLAPLETRTKRAMDAIHHFNQVLGSAQRACE